MSAVMEGAVIQTENLSKVYKRWFRPGTFALNNLTITVPRGSIFGFLGPNGAGKTTTIKILMDLIKATSGKAYVLGRPSSDVEVKAKIGFLPDSPAFSPQLTAREFLNICAKLLRLPSEGRAERIEEVLETVKMAEHAKEKIGSFSRGMLQRIGVAQAILNKPELLILDDPCLGLDTASRRNFMEMLVDSLTGFGWIPSVVRSSRTLFWSSRSAARACFSAVIFFPTSRRSATGSRFSTRANCSVPVGWMNFWPVPGRA